MCVPMSPVALCKGPAPVALPSPRHTLVPMPSSSSPGPLHLPPSLPSLGNGFLGSNLASYLMESLTPSVFFMKKPQQGAEPSMELPKEPSLC